MCVCACVRACACVRGCVRVYIYISVCVCVYNELFRRYIYIYIYIFKVFCIYLYDSIDFSQRPRVSLPPYYANHRAVKKDIFPPLFSTVFFGWFLSYSITLLEFRT